MSARVSGFGRCLQNNEANAHGRQLRLELALVGIELCIPTSPKAAHADHDVVACRRKSALTNEAL